MTHAYMIMAHNEFPLLTRLVSTLDDPCCDIYIHIDKKVEDEVFMRVKAELEGMVKRSRITFTARVNIVWGDFSMIEAELLLLREASAARHDYYHLLSGVDLPIKPHSEILRFFEENAGKEFIWYYSVPPPNAERLRMRYYYPLQHIVGHHYLRPLGILQWLLLLPQALVGVNRLRRLPEYFKGQQWFSATHEFVTDLLEFYSHEENLKPYRHTQCPDEIFVTMFACHSKYRERIFMSKRWVNSDRVASNNMRILYWDKALTGSPHVMTMDDLPMLTQSKQLWARKFSYDKHPEVVDALLERISRLPPRRETNFEDSFAGLSGDDLLYQLVKADPKSDSERKLVHEIIDRLPPELLLRLPDEEISEAKSYAIDALIGANWDSPARQAFLARYTGFRYPVRMEEQQDLARMIRAASQLKDGKALKRTAKGTKRDCRYFKKAVKKRREDSRHALDVKFEANYNAYHKAILARIKEIK
ncbi:MAG: beta-1,6-N-acetylglucosaminyltransferase [Firmicutes bacterium]|nr:beta-1,6-N-acetylglucosaminyltransferase [Bacillota bacterium]